MSLSVKPKKINKPLRALLSFAVIGMAGYFMAYGCGIIPAAFWATIGATVTKLLYPIFFQQEDWKIFLPLSRVQEKGALSTKLLYPTLVSESVLYDSKNRGTANKITVPYFSKLKRFVQNDGKTPVRQGIPTKLLYPIDIFTVPYQHFYCTLSTFLLYPTFLKPLRRKGLRAPKSIQKRYKDF